MNNRSIRKVLSFLFFFLTVTLWSQITVNPVGGGGDDAITVIFDAAQGNKELAGASKIYMHHGVVTDGAASTAWKYVKGNWGKDDGIGLMTKVAGSSDKWQITLNPTVRGYFSVPANESIFRISCVFRNVDGSKKGTIAQGTYPWGQVISNGDIYINLKNDKFVTITSPQSSDIILNQGETFDIKGEASSAVSDMKILLDEGQGFMQKAQVTSGKNISYTYAPIQSQTLRIKVTAVIGGQMVESTKTVTVVIKKPNIIASLPTGTKQGINYSSDATRATFVLKAPGKQLCHFVGDLTAWQIKDEYQMKQTPDGQYFWIEVTGLTPSKAYVYQYWVDGSIKIGDPYCEQVADPWNDKFIESSVFPGLPSYTREDLGTASVCRTAQGSFQWASTESTYVRPDINHLVIYELHIRDFVAKHSFDAIRDTLSYLKRLGVNAIELMPISEFEGNDSWGYNPSYFFAVDKYYGTKDALKRLVQAAHAEGMAVILDMVLNHTYGQSPLLKLYFDAANNQPAANNPWYNREYVGQYQWGYDLNHESTHTQSFVDDVNRFWLEEFHFDGFRFDFTKGFTNNAPGGSVDGYDASRIAILKRMNAKIREVDPKAYVILEHWAPANEEAELAAQGMKMWRNKTYDYVSVATGSTLGNTNGSDATSHIPLYNSHDERRIAEHCLTEGLRNGAYNVKDTLFMLERIKMAAALNLLNPGPKMIWQFDELGYDIDINFNGRVGRKPYVWGPGSLNYYNDPERYDVYKAYQGILHVRKTITPEKLLSATKSHAHSGSVRRLSYNTDGIDLVVIANVDTKPTTTVFSFPQSGKWYDYFSGAELNLATANYNMTLGPGEWHIYTSSQIAAPQPGVVEHYVDPIKVTPYPFTPTQEITITFDATKADPKGTQGLIGQDEIFMHAGVNLFADAAGAPLNYVVSHPQGKMLKIGTDLYEIKLSPQDYFGVPVDKDISEIGMWFRNGDNTRLGYGWKGRVLRVSVLDDEPVVRVTPASFAPDTEITISFDASRGNRELLGASKVYMHSGCGVSPTSPQTSAWNKVKGNWGQDDGIGLMTKIPGTERWEIKMRARDYYGLSATEKPYWIAAVFRSADGSKKGTAAAGPFEHGFVASNLDYFIQNQIVVNIEDEVDQPIIIYPNPAIDKITINGLIGEGRLDLYTLEGRQLASLLVKDGSDVALPFSYEGPVIYRLVIGRLVYSGTLMLIK
jgi:glycosidase